MKVKDMIKILEAQDQNATVIISAIPNYNISFQVDEEE
tara:strand:+ start:187 stop:300 length:114 start_codon:yes stop_codon:yes gene_type:complete